MSLAAAMTPADLVIHAGWLIPVEPDHAIHAGHAVVIRDGRIVAVLPSAEADARYKATEIIKLPGHVLIPGFVNAHTHAALSLLRGSTEDAPSEPWPPQASRWLSAEFIRDGSELALACMLRSGTTCFNDAALFPESTAAAVLHGGLRACLGMPIAGLASAWANTPQEYLAKGTAVRDRYKDQLLLNFAFAPLTIHGLTDERLREIHTLADELDVPVHAHLQATAAEIQQSLRQYSQRPLARLAALGWLTPNFAAVHMNQIEAGEISELAHTGVQVVHCPTSSRKLGNAACRVAELLAAGINVGLGTDSAATGTGFDMFAEMRSAAWLSKSGGGVSLPGPTLLRMATLNGARVLGLENDIGSLAPGKWADITAVNMHAPECQPLYNPLSQLLHSADRSQVSDVWVAGRRLLRHGELTTLDLEEILRRARVWRERIAGTCTEPTLI